MLIIDCYNVLFTPMPPMLAGLDEAGLCHALGRTTWVNRTGGIVIVADGKPKPLADDRSGAVLAQSPAAGVQLEWSGPGRTADSVIIRMVNEHSAPRRVTVVSTDREVRAKARRRRCRVWTSEQFITKLVEQLRRGGGAISGPPPDRPRVPPEGLAPGEVEAWLEAFGIDDQAPAPPAATPPGPTKPRDPKPKPMDEDDPFNIPGVWPPW